MSAIGSVIMAVISFVLLNYQEDLRMPGISPT